MKSPYKFLLFACSILIVACNTEKSQTDQPKPSQEAETIVASEPGVSSCGQDATVQKETARDWIFSGWQDRYSSFELGAADGEKPVKYGGFDTGHLADLFNQCPDCPYLNVAFSIPNPDTKQPRAIIMNVDSECNLVTEGSTPALLSSVNKQSDDSQSGPISYATAQEYIENWKALFNAEETTFPPNFQTIHSYTYDRDSVTIALDSCQSIAPEWKSTLRATYGVHPDTLHGHQNPDSMLIDIIFTCDCAHEDEVKFSGDFVDIANPCPPVCPTF